MTTHRWWIVLLWVTGCAGAPEYSRAGELLDTSVDDSAEDCAQSAGDNDEGCYAPSCGEEECGLYRCEDLASPPYALRFPPAQAAGGATARIQRYWGGAVPLPGRQPVFIIPWYRRDSLPSVKAARKAIADWSRREKERHHIFPRAFEAYFRGVGIDIHQYTLLVDVAEHRRVHAGTAGAPWNKDWYDWIRAHQLDATREDHFQQGGRMVERYGLIGVPMTYWKRLALSAAAGD
ncbi:TIGR02269 family lipoprotein [Myxococcus sp. CA051A]|nr:MULTISPECIES: TIGR02269 family lipoprotein [Myxococcus]NTX08737.1 TIGR02269 family lipoprotein [Myxococcus sp. CA040A]NTX11953.1 TIGR02269 family lipoprotein [Myxococcus sp. CA056]NTX65612.1 TIGR02269 family lipoprotein [Myxococcus sp. CA051A]